MQVSAPPPPPAGQRGFSSSEKPGRVLSPQEVVKLHAANLGTELAFGQMALAACVVYVMLRR